MSKKNLFPAIIMAAGESSRFWPLNEKHKTLTSILGKPLLCHLVDELFVAGIKEVIIVQGEGQDPQKIIAECGDRRYKDIKYATQSIPLGTGDALLKAEKLIKSEQFFVLNADDSGVIEYVRLILNQYQKGRGKMYILASETDHPWLYGMLNMKNGALAEIIEKPKSGEEPSNLKNDNFFFFPKKLLAHLNDLPTHPYSLIYAINRYLLNEPAGVIKLNHKTMSLKYPWHLFPILAAKLSSPNFKKSISKSAVIGKNVTIKGRVFIGADTVIGDNSVIYGPVYIGNYCRIGSSNVLRGPVDLESGVVTGAFAEIKNCLFGKNTHIHSGYFGDSLIGEDCRIGAGFTSANRRIDRDNISSIVKGEAVDTKLTAFGCVIGNNSHLGINVSIMPGVFIGRNAVVGPGTVVKENVEDNTTYYSEYRIIKKKKNI